MTPEQIEAIRERESTLAARLQQMLDTPNADRPTTVEGRKAWIAELQTAQQLLTQIDAMLAAAESAAARASLRAVKAAKPRRAAPAVQDVVVLLRLPKTARTEIRVVVAEYAGRRVFDLRQWTKKPDSEEMVPTRRGVSINAAALSQVIEALHLAQQHA